MKILALDLLAYGPFEGVRLDLSAGAEGLHILYGPNEAGKSSSLRALDALLFGVPTQTPDAFRHPYDLLRVGGYLRTAAGEELRVIRRKGRKNTLRAGDDVTVIDDAMFERVLGGVTRETFQLMYGIDHESLVRGGRDILEQRGDVGQALFGTSLGAAGLHQVLKELDAEARELFLPGGSKPKINQAVKDFKEASRQIKEHSLLTSKWVEAERVLRGAEQDLGQVGGELQAARARQNGLKRLKNILPFVSRRRVLLAQLAATGAVVVLPEDFSKRWDTGIVSRREAEEALSQREPQVVSLGQEIEAFDIPQRVLDQEETIEGFHQGLGSHRKAEHDLPARRTEHALAEAEAKRVLGTVRADLAVEGAESLRPVLGRETRLQALSTEYSLIVQRAAAARTALRDANQEAAETRGALGRHPAFRDASGLQHAVDKAKRAGKLDEEVSAKTRAAADLAGALERPLAALGLWGGTFEALAAAPLPLAATIDRFERIFLQLEQRHTRNQENRAATEGDLTRFSRELAAIAGAGTVPTEADLAERRKWRDAGWSLVRAKWIEPTEVEAAVRAYAPDGDLPTAFEVSVGEADETADRLRREASRVQQHAAALAGQQDAQHRKEELERERQEIANGRREAEEQWGAAWAPCAIAHLPPTEMRGWLGRAEQLIEKVKSLPAAKHDAATVGETRNVLRAALVKALGGLGETADGSDERLDPLLARGEALGSRITKANEERSELEKRLLTADTRAANATADWQAADTELAQWRSRWQPLVEELGLAADAQPTEAVEILGRVRELFTHLDSAERLAVRIQAMTEDQQQFGQKLRVFCELAAADLVGLPVAACVAQLHARLKQARDARARKEELEKRRDTLVDEVRKAKGVLVGAVEELAALTKVAGCRDEEAVADHIERHGQQQGLLRQAQVVEDQILELGDGLFLGELLAEAEEVDGDQLAGTLQQLATELGDLEERQNACLVARTGAQGELDRMDGSGAAAAAALEAQEHLALLGDRVEQYVRARLAHRVLRDEIQRYREENEGPLLGRASEIFSRLCLGSFDALRVDYRDDVAVLVGERSDKSRTPVEGMSSGTRDQLYLALRLAAVERAIEKSEPLPFIVDDILVNFDDQRSKATLEVLAELARKTQVVLFSHHNRAVELAQGVKGAAGVFVHQGWNGSIGS